MAEVLKTSNPPRRGGWLKRFAWIGGALIVLLVCTYFVVTSAGFVRSVVLPRVGRSLNAELSAGDMELSPFSRLVVRNLKLVPRGGEPLLTAEEVRVRYSLGAILRGDILVQECVLTKPTLTIVEHADGKSNLDPLLDALKTTPPTATQSATAKPTRPPRVEVKALTITSATVRRTSALPGSGRDVFEIANLSFSVSDLKNGQSGKLDLSAALNLEQAARSNTPAASLAASLAGKFSFTLAPDLKPVSVIGNSTLSVGKATGAFADFATLVVKLDCEATPAEVKQLAVQFTRAGSPLGELKASGPFDSAKTEGRLKVEMLSLDRKLLNLAGATRGLDFGTTTVNATSDIELAKGGNQISLAGRLDVARFQVTRERQTTPTLDLLCDYNLSLNRAERVANLKSLTLSGTQNRRPLLEASLTRPMTIAWGKATDAVGDAALTVTLTNLAFADWKALLGDAALAGVANARLKLLSQRAGQHLAFQLDGAADGVATKLGDRQITDAGVRVQARGIATDLKLFKLDDFKLEISQRNQSALTASGSGTLDNATSKTDFQLTAQAPLARLLAIAPQPEATASAGDLEFKGRVARTPTGQEVTGQLALTDFTGRYADYRFAGFGAWLDVDLATKGSVTEIRKAAGHLREKQNLGGNLEITGSFDRDRKSGQVAVRLVDFNQNGLRPFLESALAGKQLVSVTLNSTASASFAPNGDAAVKTDLRVANLVVKDPKASLPATPLEARATVDVGVAKHVAQVRQCQITLTPTDRAKNQLDLTGTLDFAKSNAITGNLKLASATLDLTRYYDLFSGQARPTATVAAPVQTQPAPPSDPNQEPPAAKLPFSNLTLNAAIGRLHLHEVDITSFQASAILNGSRVALKPCQFSLNGAPVTASLNLDLGVPGYRYDVGFAAQAVPLAPLVNTFVPERKGQVGGTTTANADFKGAGMTGASLQKNLTGQFGFLSTNMNLSVANVRSPVVNTVINVVVGIPELIKNPAATLGNLLSGLIGAGGQRGGWADQIAAAPIDVMRASGKAGNGHITLEQAEVRSATFQATATGDVALAPILTNSAIQIPVHVALGRSFGDKIGLLGPETPTNAFYLPMPSFLTVKGTVGKPERDIHKLALIALAAKTGGGIVRGIGGAASGRVGDVLDIVGGVLGAGKPGAPPSSDQTTRTNQPAAEPVGDLLRGLGNILGGRKESPKETNPPAKPR